MSLLHLLFVLIFLLGMGLLFWKVDIIISYKVTFQLFEPFSRIKLHGFDYK